VVRELPDEGRRQPAAAQAYAAPLLQQAQQGVTNAGATAPGLDPSSPQYATEQQAAQGRQSIAQLGYDTLAAIPAATYGYMGEQAATAARELPGVRADLTNQYGQLQGQRGAAVAESYGGIRQNEQNARIAYDTLDLNTGKAKADVDLGRGVDPVTGKPLPSKPPTGYGAGAPGMNSYGYTYDEWSKLSDAAKAKARAGKGKDTSAADKKAAAAEKKRVEGIRAKSGEFASKITDAVGDWDMLKREPVQLPDTEKIDPKTKKKVKVPGGTRPASAWTRSAARCARRGTRRRRSTSPCCAVSASRSTRPRSTTCTARGTASRATGCHHGRRARASRTRPPRPQDPYGDRPGTTDASGLRLRQWPRDHDAEEEAAQEDRAQAGRPRRRRRP
jgi:hypothetical protein